MHSVIHEQCLRAIMRENAWEKATVVLTEHEPAERAEPDGTAVKPCKARDHSGEAMIQSRILQSQKDGIERALHATQAIAESRFRMPSHAGGLPDISMQHSEDAKMCVDDPSNVPAPLHAA